MQISIDPVERFADNWTYLKTELNWLDRVLMLSVARQRKDTKDIDRLAQSRADRVTSHWWKGVISLDDSFYDEQRKTPRLTAIAEPAKVSYQQQLETRIRASHQKGIVLALPLLCDRLKLSLFEKNLILLSLAPEVNRRYARLYRYLQGEDPVKTDLPTVDLALRLLCRNDLDWRSARNSFAATSPLSRHYLLTLLPADADTLLNQYVKLTPDLIAYLLSEQPTAQMLEDLLKPSPSSSTQILSTWTAIDWSTLVLPALLLHSLHHLELHPSKQWINLQQPGAFSGASFSEALVGQGRVVLLAGAAGTGKTLAAGAIAHARQTALVSIDFARLNLDAYSQVLEEVAAQAPQVLLLKSAHLGLGRLSPLADAEIARFLDRRRSSSMLTLLETRVNHAIRPHWRRQLYQTLTFLLPSLGDRLRLWQQAFPAQVILAADLDWHQLAQPVLSGGEICSIAREAVLYWSSSFQSSLNITHLIPAFEQHGKRLSCKFLKM